MYIVVKLLSFYKDKWLNENGKEESLPGFSDFTNRQMFWMSWARTWCTKYNDFNSTYVRNFATTKDPHPAQRYRILGPLQNDENFAKDFNCPAKSGMAPEKRCKFW